MTRMTRIVALILTAGAAWGQNPKVINSTHDNLKGSPPQAGVHAAPTASQPSAAPRQPASVTPKKPAPGSSLAIKASPAAKVRAQKAAAVIRTDSAKPATKPAVSAATATAKKKVPVQKNSEKVAVANAKTPPAEEAKKDVPKPISLTGRRDPFVSPVVNRSMVGSGCSTGKRCLAIDQISLKGIVKSDNGMIAVVVNALEKAYFLRENDPVFNGYVVKITGDSIIFKETIQDKLGKPFTREVTKRISTPAV